MKVLISGTTGMVGSTLYDKFIKERHDVIRLVRSLKVASGNDIIFGAPTENSDLSRFEGFDVVIHLAGESIAGGRWTAKRKQRIRDSRVNGTKNLATVLAGLRQPPKVFICASAIGFYGNRGAEALDEQSQPGTDFLSQVCQEWEAASKPASDKGIRTVNLRFGVILSKKGGALKMMLCPFKLGVAGNLGSGTQYMSWVTLDDVVRAVETAIQNSSLTGPVNVVAPEAVTNAVFTQTLGDVLHRPTLLPAPEFGIRLLLGEMADALLLASQNVKPKKLQAAGFDFRYPKLDEALKAVISQ